MFTPAFGARDGETCATPASARGALAATLRHPSSFVFATPMTARHDAPAFTPQPRAFRRENDAVKPSNARGSPMALDVAPETASASGAHKLCAPGGSSCADPHAQWHTPAPCVETRPLGAAPTSDGKIVFGRIPRHDGRAPNPKRDKVSSGAKNCFGTTHLGDDALSSATNASSANARLSSSSSYNDALRNDTLKPPRTVRVLTETALATLLEEPEVLDDVAGPTVARQLFDEAEISRNKSLRSSLAMRSPRKPHALSGLTFTELRKDTERLDSGRKQPNRSQPRDETLVSKRSSFAEPKSTLSAIATEAPSAPIFGARSFGVEGKPMSRTASRVGRLLLEQKTRMDREDAEIQNDAELSDGVYASPFATSRELRGYGSDEDDVAIGGGDGCARLARRRSPARGLGGVEGFVEAFESGNDAFGASVAGGFEFGGEHKGGLPASRLEDRFASLGLGLAAER